MLNKVQYQELLSDVQSQSNLNVSQVLENLKARQVFILDAVKIVRDLKGVTLGEAQLIVSTHPAWIESHAAHEEFHHELEKDLSEKDIFHTQ